MSDDHPQMPQDPAGTQPKVDPSTLLPARIQREEPPREEPSSLEALPHDLPGPAEPPREAPHAAKFQFLLGALLAVGLVALVSIGVIAASRVGESSGEPWSAWKPSDGGLDGARQIADHVAPQYRLSNGEQMVYVSAGPLEALEVPLRVAMRARGSEGGEITVEDGDAVLYRMCGLADRCTIQGEPTQKRAVLLRREALELAMYTFRYLRGIDQVVMFMPPSFVDVRDNATAKIQKVRLDNQALLFKRSDLEGIIQAPLRQTLPAPPPPVRRALDSPDASLVKNITVPRAFSYSLVPGNSENSAFLVLEKLNAQEALVRQRQRELDAQKAAAEAAGPGAIEAEAGG